MSTITTVTWSLAAAGFVAFESSLIFRSEALARIGIILLGLMCCGFAVNLFLGVTPGSGAGGAGQELFAIVLAIIGLGMAGSAIWGEEI